jgi:hypothetical protein
MRIVQFSPIRSGSTLIYNMIRNLSPGSDVIKTHDLSVREPGEPVVCTYRDPVDVVASSIKRFKLRPTDDVVAYHIAMVRECGMEQTLTLLDDHEALLLKYENFVKDQPSALRTIAAFMKIREYPLEEILRRLDINVILAECGRFQSFSEYDPVTLLHGCHVSETRGVPGAGYVFLSTAQIKMVTEEFSLWMKQMGYL